MTTIGHASARVRPGSTTGCGGGEAWTVDEDLERHTAVRLRGHRAAHGGFDEGHAPERVAGDVMALASDHDADGAAESGANSGRRLLGGHAADERSADRDTFFDPVGPEAREDVSGHVRSCGGCCTDGRDEQREKRGETPPRGDGAVTPVAH